MILYSYSKLYLKNFPRQHTDNSFCVLQIKPVIRECRNTKEFPCINVNLQSIQNWILMVISISFEDIISQKKLS